MGGRAGGGAGAARRAPGGCAADARVLPAASISACVGATASPYAVTVYTDCWTLRVACSRLCQRTSTGIESYARRSRTSAPHPRARRPDTGRARVLPVFCPRYHPIGTHSERPPRQLLRRADMLSHRSLSLPRWTCRQPLRASVQSHVPPAPHYCIVLTDQRGALVQSHPNPGRSW